MQNTSGLLGVFQSLRSRWHNPFATETSLSRSTSRYLDKALEGGWCVLFPSSGSRVARMGGFPPHLCPFWSFCDSGSIDSSLQFQWEGESGDFFYLIKGKIFVSSPVTVTVRCVDRTDRRFWSMAFLTAWFVFFEALKD